MTERVQIGEPGLYPGSESGEPAVVVVGVGGAGCNFVNRVSCTGIPGVVTMAVNTDRIHIELVDADKKLLIGKSRVHGTGIDGDPVLGKICMEEAAEEFLELLGSPDVVFIVAGMGGGTGTGAAPVAARLAGGMGAVVLGVAYMPFSIESWRVERAREGLEEFRRSSQAVMVMENDRLLSMAPTLPVNLAFDAFDQPLIHRIAAMVERMRISKSIIELERVAEALPLEGLAMVRCDGDAGEARVVCEAVDHPLLEIDCIGAPWVKPTDSGARSVLGGVSPMPPSNVLVSTRPVQDGSGKRILPLVSGMRTYPTLQSHTHARPPSQSQPQKSTRQTLLIPPTGGEP
ncbi:MAG: hypothetical protein QW379_08850 [Thermoplasmata archaeon]